MTKTQNIKTKSNNYRQHRFLRLPKKSGSKHTVNRYSNNKFQNKIYTEFSAVFIAWVYIRNLLKFSIPAILLHGFHLLILGIGTVAFGEAQHLATPIVHTLFMAYGICAVFALAKINSQMAYYNIETIANKYNINRLAWERILELGFTDTDNEFAVMDKFRKKYNKTILFPSSIEMAATHKIYSKSSNYNTGYEPSAYAENLIDNLNMTNRRSEHVAAKRLADLKQERFGGVNEYDLMVKRYKCRTIPVIRTIIEEMQKL